MRFKGWLRINPSGRRLLLARLPAGTHLVQEEWRNMAYVITEPCIGVKDRACVDVCPVDCIYEGPEMLFIHPDECIDCGACVPACPVEAIRVDRATGAKVVLEDVCVGCKVCTIACPFGTVNYVQDTGKVHKCDLCGGNPACAEACPTAAITFIDANWTGMDKMKQWADKLGNQPSAA